MKQKDTIYSRPLSIEVVETIPSGVEREIKEYLKNKKHEFYGSFAATTYNSENSRKPGDIDVAVSDVKKTTEYIKTIFNKYKVKCRLDLNKKYDRGTISIPHGNEWLVVVDVNNLERHQNQELVYSGDISLPPVKSKDNFFVQSIDDQMNRKYNSIISPDFSEKRSEKDITDYTDLAKTVEDSDKLKGKALLFTGSINDFHKVGGVFNKDFTKRDADVLKKANQKGIKVNPHKDMIPDNKELDYINTAIKYRITDVENLDFNEDDNIIYNERLIKDRRKKNTPWE